MNVLVGTIQTNAANMNLSENIRSRFLKAQELNSEGIAFLKESLHVDAIVSFHQSLKYLLERCDDSSELLRENNHPFDAADLLKSSYEFKSRSSGLIFSVELPRTKPLMEHNYTFLMFNSALQLLIGNEDILQQPTMYYNILTAVVTYNVGLAYHLLSINNGVHLMLAWANDFYFLAYASVSEYDSNVGASLDMLLLALTNNIGHVNAVLDSWDKARICCDELARVLLRDEKYSGREDYLVFYMNTLFSPQQHLWCAASA